MTALRADTMECSPEIQAALDRMKLPIRCVASRTFSGDYVWIMHRFEDGATSGIRHPIAEASQAYFALCAQLLPLPGATAGASAPAHSIEPAAALIPPPAEVTAPPSDNAVTAAGAISPGASAALSSGVR